MIIHLITELVDTVATAGAAWVFYFLYLRRSEARLKLVAAAFAILFAGGGVHLLLNDQGATRSVWATALIRLLGGFVLMVGAAASPGFFRRAGRMNALLIAAFLALAGGLATVFLAPLLGARIDVEYRRVVDILQLLVYATAGIMLLLRPVMRERHMNLLLVGAISAFAASRVPFLWRVNPLDMFSYLGHYIRLVADLLLSLYAYFFAVGTEKALNQALGEAVNRYKNLLSLITTAELAASSLDLSTILNRICRELALDLRFDRCYVILKNGAEKSPTVVALYHRDQDLFIPPTCLSLVECPRLHDVVEKGIVEEISNLKEAALSECERRILGNIGSMLLIPLQVEKKAMGALYFWRQQAGGFTPDLVRLCQTAALVASLAIRKAFDYENLRTAYLGTVNAMVKSIEAKSPFTGGHSERVSQYVEILGQALKMDTDHLDRLKLAALLHDLGKLATPGAILSKPGMLTDSEQEEIKKHPSVGAEIVAEAPQLLDVLPVVRWHHERVDGAGYPDGLKGEQIPLEARITAIADAFDAMTSDRPYRRRMTEEEASKELEKNAGTQFDAQLVEIFCKSLRSNKSSGHDRSLDNGEPSAG